MRSAYGNKASREAVLELVGARVHTFMPASACAHTQLVPKRVAPAAIINTIYSQHSQRVGRRIMTICGHRSTARLPAAHARQS
jgi:hypothetical protein